MDRLDIMGQFAFKSKIIWSGQPWQIVNLQFFLFTLLMSIIPIINIICWIMLIYRVIDTYCIKYEIYHDRIQIIHGILCRHHDNLFLYRTKDVVIVKPFLWRIFGFGALGVINSDARRGPVEVLRGITDTEYLYETILMATEQQRDEKGIREIDIR